MKIACILATAFWVRACWSFHAASATSSSFGLPRGGSSSSSSSSSSQRSSRSLLQSATNEAAESVKAAEAVYPPKYEARTKAEFDKYVQDHQQSIQDPSTFWGEQAHHFLEWDKPFKSVMNGSLKNGDITWFNGGKLNVAYNAIDRHVYAGKGDNVAMIWEGDEPTDVRHITYAELMAEVSQIANALKQEGVRKGDVVTIYMPMIPQLPMTMLACARIGAVHSVVFAGFSAEALAQRIVNAQSKFVVTADIGLRGAKKIPLKDIVDEARTREHSNDFIEKVMVWERFYDATKKDAPYIMQPKDVRMNPLVNKQRPYSPPESMDSEDNLFILYTSGSTGQPKGVVHTTGGYALYAAFTAKTTFDLKEGDRFACVADAGWITGHSYVVYGPLLNGITTFVFESTPLYPDAGRYWDMVERHRLTHFYTAPTAIRSLIRFGEDVPAKYDLSSLEVLGSVGEPINPEAWRWYYEHVGRKQCTIVDTYWQTETGGHIITNLPGITPMKPGSCTLPMYGIDPVVLDPLTGDVLDEPTDPATGCTEGVLAVRQPWPGMARTCLGDHERFMAVYLKPYPGYYITGDAVLRDKDGFHFITGRVDDVLSVSGHRIGTAEIESALVAHPTVAQAAIVGRPHPIKGQAIVGFVMLRGSAQESPELLLELRKEVRDGVGPFAAPDELWIVPSLPMTRSGKIMRRILRKIVAGEIDSLGDTSTLADPSIVDVCIQKVKESELANAMK